jgi:hypothetical protein
MHLRRLCCGISISSTVPLVTVSLHLLPARCALKTATRMTNILQIHPLSAEASNILTASRSVFLQLRTPHPKQALEAKGNRSAYQNGTNSTHKANLLGLRSHTCGMHISCVMHEAGEIERTPEGREHSSTAVTPWGNC